MSFIDRCNCKEIKRISSHKEDSKTFETNNEAIAFSILFVSYSSKEIRHAHISNIFRNVTQRVKTK